jgi:L-alanine-DL-glutamate epimerase-like enolase superfamily enzyme
VTGNSCNRWNERIHAGEENRLSAAVAPLVALIAVTEGARLGRRLAQEPMAQTLRLYEETPKIEAGQLVVPDKPGLGLVFDPAAMKRYQVGSVVRAGSGPA